MIIAKFIVKIRQEYCCKNDMLQFGKLESVSYCLGRFDERPLPKLTVEGIPLSHTLTPTVGKVISLLKTSKLGTRLLTHSTDDGLGPSQHTPKAPVYPLRDQVKTDSGQTW